MKILRKRFDCWDENTKRKLRYATLGGGYVKRFMLAFPLSPTLVAVDGVQVAGWVFALTHAHNKTVLVNVFVNERYRRRGVATLLIEEALKDFRVISLAAWNKATKRLFGKLAKAHPGRIIILKWGRDRRKYDTIIKKAMH